MVGFRFKNELIGLSGIFRAILFLGIVSFSTWSNAEEGPEFLIAPQGVKVGSAWFPFGEERIDETENKYLDTLKKDRVECHATTRFAVQKDKAIVLIETGRRKESRSIGLLCGFSFFVGGFDAPYTFTHSVLRTGANPTIETIVSSYDPGRPEIKVNELKTVDLLNQKKQLAGYLRIQLLRESGLVSRSSKLPIRTRQISREEMAQLPPLAPISAAD